MRSPLRSPAQVEGTQGFLPQPGKALERPSSTRLEARFPYHGSGAMTRSPSPLAWRPDFPGAPREARSEEHTCELQSPKDLVCRLLLEKKKKKQTVVRDWELVRAFGGASRSGVEM